jgi:hypothetical protein
MYQSTNDSKVAIRFAEREQVAITYKLKPPCATRQDADRIQADRAEHATFYSIILLAGIVVIFSGIELRWIKKRYLKSSTDDFDTSSKPSQLNINILQTVYGAPALQLLEILDPCHVSRRGQ